MKPLRSAQQSRISDRIRSVHQTGKLLLVGALAAGVVRAQPVPLQQLNVVAGQVDGRDVAEMLTRYLKTKAFRQLDARKAAVAARVRSRAAVDEYRREFREKLWKNLGGMPPRTPLNARVTAVVDRPDHRIEKIVFESQPGFFVTANLYLPKPLRTANAGKHPAILFPLGHEQGAKAHDAWQHLLVTFARRGYVCLAWDTLGQGERIQLWDDDFLESKVIRSTTEHTMLGLQTVLVGDALARYTIWDGIRALDYLASRQEVDTARIGVTGNSGGGTHSAYLGSLEDRLSVVAPSCYLTSWRRLLETIGPQDAEQCIPNSIADGLDHPDFVLAAAPRPYLMLVAIRDFFSIAGARDTFAESQRIYDSIGEAAKLAKFEWDDGHGYSQPRREAAYRWFSRYFEGQENAAPEGKVEVLDERDLWGTRTGQVATEFAAANQTVFDVNRARFEELRKQRVAAPDLASMRRFVQFAPGGGGTAPPAKRYGEVPGDGYRIEKYMISTEPGIEVPALLYVGAGSGKRPVTVFIDGTGKANAHAAAAEMAKSGQGLALSIDVRGLGETRGFEDKYGRDWAGYFGNYEASMTALLTGKPLVTMRAEDIARVVDWLSARPDVDRDRVSLHGKELGAIPALFAAAFDSRIREVTLERAVRSYESVIRHRIHRLQWENAVTGVLRHFDLPDLERAMAPRPVRWIEPLYPNGRLMSR